MRPPVGDPSYNDDEFWLLNKTLYGLRRSPKHWYNVITSILKKMNLKPSPHDPCLYSGVINTSSHDSIPLDNSDTSTSHIINDSATSSTRHNLHVGIYVDDFVFYSTDPAKEKLFQLELAKHIKVDFMGDVDFFLSTAFTWLHHDDGHISVHLSQTAFTEFTSHHFGVDKMNQIPHMTPYRSGLHIGAIPSSDADDSDLKRRTKIYQSIVGSIKWLATCTCPDISPVLTFLASYSNAPHAQH